MVDIALNNTQISYDVNDAPMSMMGLGRKQKRFKRIVDPLKGQRG